MGVGSRRRRRVGGFRVLERAGMVRVATLPRSRGTGASRLLRGGRITQTWTGLSVDITPASRGSVEEALQGAAEPAGAPVADIRMGAAREHRPPRQHHPDRHGRKRNRVRESAPANRLQTSSPAGSDNPHSRACRNPTRSRCSLDRGHRRRTDSQSFTRPSLACFRDNP